MTDVREYRPAPLIHRPDCPQALPYRDKIQVSVVVAAEMPNGIMHHCFDHLANPKCVVEPRWYPPHHYRPSTRQLPGTTVPGCAVCNGTHPGERGRSTIQVAGAPKLIRVEQPALQVVSAGRVILPGDVRPGELEHRRGPAGSSPDRGRPPASSSEEGIGVL